MNIPFSLLITAIVVFLATPAGAQSADVQPSAPTAARQPALRLILLGTAGGPPLRRDRSEPSSLLVVDGRPYLIDVGTGALQRLALAGFQAQDVDAIFITHQHLDHNGGLADVIEYGAFGRRARPVGVVGPFGTKAMVRASMDLLAASRRIFSAEGLGGGPDPATIYQAGEIPPVAQPGIVYHDANITVTATENTHYQLIRPGDPSFGKDRSYGLRFVTPAGVVVFTGDSGPSAALIDLARGADILVSEVIDVPGTMKFVPAQLIPDAASRARMIQHMSVEHLTPEEVGKLAAAAGVKMVVLTHFSPGADTDADTQPLVAGVQKVFHGPVLAGRDLVEVDLPPVQERGR